MATIEEETREMFKKYDIDDSKSLELDEIRKLLKQIAVDGDFPCPGDKEIAQIFKDYDSNHDNRISFDEFCKMWSDLKKLSED